MSNIPREPTLFEQLEQALSWWDDELPFAQARKAEAKEALAEIESRLRGMPFDFEEVFGS